MDYNKIVSNRVKDISPSSTMEINTLTMELKKEGIHVINLSVGELDFETPEAIANEGIRAIKTGKTRYTPAAGTLNLRQAIIDKYNKEYGVQFSINEVCINAGAKNSLFNVFMTVCAEGDEVILPAPYWVSYTEQIKLAGATPVIIDCEEINGFKMTPEQLKNSINPKTKALVITSPNNPTGTVYTNEELSLLLEVIKDTEILIIFDEIYDKLIYDDQKHCFFLEQNSEYKDRTIIVNGHSKVYAMTGWRLGWTIAPEPIIKQIVKFQSHSLGGACTISQEAGTFAMTYYSEDFKVTLQKRRDLLVSRLNKIKGISCVLPEGAFYAFPNIKRLLGLKFREVTITSSIDFCKLLLKEAHIATVPGSAFGLEGYFRISYGVSINEIEQAMDKLEAFIMEIQ